jgi:hypothetical protein
MDKIKFLMDKGFNHGDEVDFRVENQNSGLWFGPLSGKLNFSTKDPYIDVIHNGNPGVVTINNGYDAYIGTIKKLIKLPSNNIYYINHKFN